MLQTASNIWRTKVFGYSDDLVCVFTDDRLWKETDMYTCVRVKFDDGTCIRVRYMNDTPEGTRWCIRITKQGTNTGVVESAKYPLNDVYYTNARPVEMRGIYDE